MNAEVYDIKGIKKQEIALPKIFHTRIREDIVQKYFEAEKLLSIHPSAPYDEAGRRHSASGTISHRRHEWKGHYGKGISRVPRKTMWRRGTQFFWIAAEVSGTRGGRRAHPPRLNRRIRKINKKEKIIARNSAIAATADSQYIAKRYSTFKKTDLKFPLVIDLSQHAKSKEIINLLKSLLKNNFHLALRAKSVRAGKGKSRGRRYKSKAGILLVKSNNENIKLKGIEVISSGSLKMSSLYPLGRLTAFTEKAIHELGGKR